MNGRVKLAVDESRDEGRSETVTTVAIVGTVGVPARYGGFETLAENLVRYRGDHAESSGLLVYCSSRGLAQRPDEYLGAELRYIGLPANGVGSIAYDAVSLLDAVRKGAGIILLLGVSGAIALPLIRLISRARIITNIDGIEWRRDKWRGPARWFLRFSEWLAVRCSHAVVADNDAIAAHAKARYEVDCEVIPYGGDHALMAGEGQSLLPGLAPAYTLSICRIEPENNVAMVLEAFSRMPGQALVFVGNWNASRYGQDLKERFVGCANLTLLDPVYDVASLHALRAGAALYVHGHSAGGTNPSLVEIMHFGCPVLAYDCVFNRSTTEERALFFKDADQLCSQVGAVEPQRAVALGDALREVARRRYTWEIVGAAYFRLFHAVESPDGYMSFPDLQAPQKAGATEVELPGMVSRQGS